MDEFMTVEVLATFAGLATATGIIVQFTKQLLKKQFADYTVRIFAFVIALVLTFIFAPAGNGLSGIVLTILNAMLVTLAAMGGYEAISDPTARKTKE